mmetsp:Transcript_8981/g.11910  ORF Transcript_8981/g.11910 Transcript_8981/m.11910 type:complete len:573 (+) Transcript_8981:1153-2871(+)
MNRLSVALPKAYHFSKAFFKLHQSNNHLRSLVRFSNHQSGLRQLPSQSQSQRKTAIISVLGGIFGVTSFAFSELNKEDDAVVSNWSGTHEVVAKSYFQPESISELEEIVAAANKSGQKLRPVGNALSPNGIGLSSEGMVSLAMLDNIVSVDPKTGLVTVQAGAKVEQVVEALRPYGLTLQNYASIAEQQIGGFIQVGAHGTGATIPPVDEQVVGMKIVTPGKGTIMLTAQDEDPSDFHMARVGLGCMGVVAEVTLQCVPAHRLTEHTFVTTREFVKENHTQLLQENQHIRYMWIPYTNEVVVVACNPLERLGLCELHPLYDPEERFEPLKALLKELRPDIQENTMKGMSFSELRDLLLAVAPLDQETVVRINEAEAEFWKRSQGYRTDWSDKILGFDCGGQQWVSEVAFPCGTLDNPTMADLNYMEELLTAIEENKIPAPAPIEQRWTASSKSSMSPAYSQSPGDLHSWVGIIMYLPTDEKVLRNQITERFFEYVKTCEDLLWDRYGAVIHWAKIENPKDKEVATTKQRLSKRFPVDQFTQLRQNLDPNQILGNTLVNTIMPPVGSNDCCKQ